MTTKTRPGSGFFPGWFAGSLLANALHGMAQDSHGGLEGYCAYLHEPGRWVEFGLGTCALYTVCVTWAIFSLAKWVRA